MSKSSSSSVHKVSAIVLAAGLSTRMQGEQKLFLAYRNKTILENVISALQDSKVDEIIVVSSPLTYERIKDMSITCQPAGRGITLVTNPDHNKGMTTTIQRGVTAANPDATGYMICLGDMPRITSAEYDLIIDTFNRSFDTDPKAILLPFHQGQKGNPVIFSSAYHEDILNHKEMEGCKAIVQSNKAHLVKLDMKHDHVLVDVDTREAYESLNS